jgi:steroid delta-isomerase-like uncharacterized protein
MSENLEKIARQGVEDFNRNDWEAIRRSLVDGYQYEETGTGVRLEGSDALLEHLQGLKRAMSDLAGTVERIAVDGDDVIIEVRWRGTHDGPMALPDGELPSTGRSIDIWGILWQVYRDGLLVHERHHVDTLTMMSQLGQLPS